MKKIMMVLLVLVGGLSLEALPMGNPTEASFYRNGFWWEGGSGCEDPCNASFNWCDAWSLRFGFSGDYVFERYLEQAGEPHSLFEHSELYTNSGLIVLNICNRLDLFTKLGASSFTFAKQSEFEDVEVRTEYLFKTRFSWSVGGRLTLWQCGCFGLGIEGEYFQFKPRLRAINNLFGVVNFDNLESRYREWQVGLGASYMVNCSCPRVALIPYLGATYSRARLTHGDLPLDPGLFFEAKSRKLWTFVVGTTLELCDIVGVSVEGRFLGERAVHVNGQFRF